MDEELKEISIADWSNYQPGNHETIKKIIRNNINSMCAVSVANGFYLNYINEYKLYLEDGYSGIGEYAAAEYGIPKDRCSWLMKIANRFCIEHSPALLPEYRDFSISKLREMAYLDDQLLEQVAITTTVAEIKSLRKPEPDPEKVATSQLEPDCFIKNQINDSGEDDLKCSGGISEDCNTCDKSEPECPKLIDDLELSVRTYNCLKRAGIDTVEKLCGLQFQEIIHINNISLSNISEIDEKLKPFGLSLNLKDERMENNIVDSMNETHEIEDDNTEIVDKEAESENDVDESVIEEPEDDDEDVPCRNCKYDTMNPDEYLNEHPGATLPCIACDDMFGSWRPKDFEEEAEPEDNFMRDPDLSCKYDPEARCLVASKESCKRNNDDGCMHCSGSWGEEDYIAVEPEQNETGLVLDCYSQEEGWHKEIVSDKSDMVETLEADIIQTEYVIDDAGKEAGILEIIRVTPVRHEDDPDCPAGMGPKRGGCTRAFINESFDDAKGICKCCWDKYLRRLISEDRDIKEPVEIKIPEIKQPELPILKNNDLRQEWLKNYRDWGIWYKDEHINVTYYRYDFIDGTYLVVDEYVSWDIYNRKERTSAYYHLVGKVLNSQGDKSKYSHYDNSLSELVEHLKDVQKKK